MSYLYIKRDQKQLPSFGLGLSPRKFFAGAMFGLGIILFSSAVLPIITFQLEYAVKFRQIINPLSVRFYSQTGGILGENTTDYTQLNNWFVADSVSKTNSPAQSSLTQKPYYLSIPELKINNAIVEIGSQDLKKSLVQYPQTALPGEPGNTIIFGHSVLPQFFNPNSYITIFSTLYRLNVGDQIFVNYDNIKYKYRVEEMYEVKPTDLSVLHQRFDGRYLTLITCSPPGTYLRRLVVKAHLVDI